MDGVELSEAVARSLAWVFPHHRERAFLDYLSLTYSEVVTELPEFEKLCLAEAEYGNTETGEIGGIIKRWWLTDQDGFRTVPWREMPRFGDDFNKAEGSGRVYYRFPLVKFLREGLRVTFGEAFGPRLACRKIGRVKQSVDRICIADVRVVWNVNSLGSISPLPQVSPALDVNEERAGRTRRGT